MALECIPRFQADLVHGSVGDRHGEGPDASRSEPGQNGSFTRAFTLPEGTYGGERIRAELNEGVLTLVLPKKPELQPKRIEVKVAEKPES